MVRYSGEHKEATRQAILKEAACELRRNGPDKVSVAALMKKAGLTHGGFYAHFASKDALIADAISWMYDNRLQFFSDLLESHDRADGLSRYIDAYLSAAHRLHPESGCPVPALAADISRLSADIQQRYQQGVEQTLALFAGAIPDSAVSAAGVDRNTLARSAFSELSGAILIARSMNDETQAQQWLGNCRDSLKARLHLQPHH